MGADLGGMTVQEATAAIQSRARADLERPLRLQLRDGAAQVSAQDLGLTLDAVRTAQRALSIGRTGGWIDRWGHRVEALATGQETAPLVGFQQAKATAVLSELARTRVDQPVRDAELTISTGGPVIEPSQTGYTLDVGETLKKLPSSLEALYAQQEPVRPVVHETQPAVTEQHLAEASQMVTMAWSRPLSATFQNRTWTLPVDQLRPMIALQGQGAGVSPALKADALQKWVTSVAADINRPAKDARIKVTTGSVDVVPGRDQHEVDVAATAAQLQQAAFAGNGQVKAVVRVTPPDITDAELRAAAAEADALVRRPLSLQLGDRSWTLSRKKLTTMLQWRGSGEKQQPYLEPRELRNWVNAVGKDIYRAPKDAEIVVTSNGVRAIPEQSGIRMAAWKTFKTLRAALLDPSGKVEVSTRKIAADVTARDLRKAVDTANLLIGEPVRLTWNGEQWTADLNTLRDWLRWNGEGAQTEPYLSEDAITGFVASVADEVYQAPQNAYITIDSGLPELVPDIKGVEVDTEAAVALVGDLATATSRSAELPTYNISPSIVAADLQDEYNLMSAWTSDRLYMTLGELTWWLDREDITEAVWWNGQGGTELNPYLGVDTMEEQIRLYVAEPPDTMIDYRATAEDAVAALEDGHRTIEITSRHVNTPAAAHIGDEAHWAGNFPAKWIDLNLKTQSIAAYEGGKQVRLSLITSGRPELATPTGVYSVMDKLSPYTFISPWPKGHKWWYPTAESNFALRFRYGGLYIHDAPWRTVYGPGTNGSGRSGADSTGSHGCVNVPYEMMAWLYSWSEVGTPIIIHK